MGFIKFLFRGQNVFHYAFWIWMAFPALLFSILSVIANGKIDWSDVGCFCFGLAGITAFITAWKEYKIVEKGE